MKPTVGTVEAMLISGSRVGHYEVRELIGAGGMGEVYRAVDTRLGRHVALKVLPQRVTLDPHRRARFEREARLLASLNHPNIATLLGFEQFDETSVLVLEFVGGQTLADRLDHHPVTLADALAVAEQVAAGIEVAHDRGIVHRDLKPGNIQLRPDGTVKLLDFGLAKAFAPLGGEAAIAEVTATDLGMGERPMLGTPAYMSPEQARGLPVDKRTDIWAFGCVLYELLTGRRAFPGDRVSDVIAKVIEREPDYDALPEEITPGLRRLLERCLAKDVHRRLRDIGDAKLEIEETRAAGRGDASGARHLAKIFRRPRLTRSRSVRYLTSGLLVVAASAAVALLAGLESDSRWVAEEAIPQIERYLDVADWESAYAIAKQAEARDPGNRELGELWTRISWRVTIPSDPPGAAVYRQAYAATGGEWELLGQTPLKNIRIPYGLSRLRFERGGYRPMVRAIGGGHLNWAELKGANELLDMLLVGPDAYRLDTTETLPADMVRVPGWTTRVGNEYLEVNDFFIGHHEVTNAEFKTFVDAGGYRRPELWEPVVVNGSPVPFEKAIVRFADRTGRLGPSTWEAGDYPNGREEFPVAGVSWYEAAAYARFRGAELPTAHHWQQALATSMFPWLLPLSNFGGDGPRRGAESRAMSFVGAFDMAGNVREWTATALGDERIILGGSWNDAYYIAGTSDTSAAPLDRSPGNGIRLAIRHDTDAVTARLAAPMHARSTVSAVLTRRPVSDDVYAAYGRIFDYKRGPLRATVLSTHTTRTWSRERIEFDAGYRDERMLLHLYLPTGGSPPYQTVVYWPGWDTFALYDVDEYFAKQIDFVVKSGRAVAFPIYRGVFERRVGSTRVRPDFDTTAWRDNTIDAVKDLRRSIDYLETRSEINGRTLALLGYSWGGVNGPIALAHEPRLKLGVINIGLLPPMASIPEVDPLHALPRVRVPVLMFSGEFDAMVPLANARRYFELLGVPAADKRHRIAPGGHYVPRDILIRDTLDWFDRYFGPAK